MVAGGAVSRVHATVDDKGEFAYDIS